MNKYATYWSGSKGVDRITPGGPEVPIYAQDAVFIQTWSKGRVCDFGCGTGRFSSLFTPDTYLGVDQNEEAINIACLIHPEFQFDCIGWMDGTVPPADTYLLYTVCLHIPDDSLSEFLSRFSNRIIIAECMEPRFRNNQFNNSRSKQDYIDCLCEHGFQLKAERTEQERPFTLLVFDQKEED